MVWNLEWLLFRVGGFLQALGQGIVPCAKKRKTHSRSPASPTCVNRSHGGPGCLSSGRCPSAFVAVTAHWTKKLLIVKFRGLRTIFLLGGESSFNEFAVPVVAWLPGLFSFAQSNQGQRAHHSGAGWSAGLPKPWFSRSRPDSRTSDVGRWLSFTLSAGFHRRHHRRASQCRSRTKTRAIDRG